MGKSLDGPFADLMNEVNRFDEDNETYEEFVDGEEGEIEEFKDEDK